MINLTPIEDAGLGAKVTGLDLRKPLAADDLAALEAAWAQHLVLIFPDQPINDDQLIAFSKAFGPLDQAPASEYQASGAQDGVAPAIWIISNVKQDGKAIGALGDAEALWHTDMSYVPEPPRASVLHAREIPSVGGNTGFANMIVAYDSLPADLKAAIKGRTIHHDSSLTSTGEVRVGASDVTDVTKAPGASHPIERLHVPSGKTALYLGRRKNAWIEGLPARESEALLDRLWDHATDPAFQYEHIWSLGDLVMWDNCAVIHRRDAFDPGSRRIMHRTQIAGEAPRAAR